MRILIIGAGPTGLAAASRLQKLGADWRLLEAESHPGGLSASFLHRGFTWDIGGHIVFSHYGNYDRMLDSVMAPDNWIEHERRTFIRMLGQWVPYPFQNNIGCLPAAERDECLEGLEEAQARTHPVSPANFQEWIDRNSGRGIARLFLNPYNFKVWAYRPETLSAHWLGDRVARPDVAAIRRRIDRGDIDAAWGPNRSFRFPASGGTGEIWRRLACTLDQSRVEYNARVVQVDAGKHSVRLEDGRELAFDALISTMPLDSLVAVSGLAFLKAHAGRLVHNSAHILGFGLRGSIPRTADGMCWLYFPEEADPFYRVTMFSFYSPANAPEGCYSLMAEVSESPHKPVSTDDLDITCLTRLRTAGLAGADDPLVSTWTRKIERAYPVPSLGRDEALNAIIPELEKRAIYSRGRFGAWKYEVGNMDHSYAQGIEIADRLVLNSPEITTQRPEYVNEQGGGRQ